MESRTATWRTRVRTYECDALGHVNNAWYLAYLQQATAEAWGRPLPVRWELRRLAIEYLSPAVDGDELEVVAWPNGLEASLPACGYEMRRVADQGVVVRALAAWAWRDAETAEPMPLADPWPVVAPAAAALPRPLRLPPDVLGAHAYHWQHKVRRYELDASGRVGPVEVLRWLEEAKYVACVEVGWPLDRMLDAGCVIVQVRHDSEFRAGLRFGDAVEIVSRIYEVGRVKGTWRHEVRRGGELVAVDYSSGAFLDRAGRPNPPPPEMLEALLEGR